MISAQIRAQVRQRAQNACEYCHLHQDDSPLAALHVEHIIPKIHGGSDDVENLALACIDCNLHKGTNLTGFDPETNVISELLVALGLCGGESRGCVLRSAYPCLCR